MIWYGSTYCSIVYKRCCYWFLLLSICNIFFYSCNSFGYTYAQEYVRLGIMAVGGSVWFFITTNFAEWMIWDYYPKTIEGLITCYTLAIPFFKNTLISTCLFTGLLTFSIKYLEVVNKKTNHLISNLLARI